ncbi:LEA type 2 family protein [bacterium]|nr:LEA type 2 family protein [bacterium]
MKHRFAAMAAIASLLLITLAGCEAVQKAWNDVSFKPTAHVKSANIQDMGLDSSTLNFDVDVNNPYSFELPISGLTYALESNGSTFANGETTYDKSIPSQASETLGIPLELKYDDVLKTLKTIKPGEAFPYNANMALKFKVAGEEMTIPLAHSGSIPIPAIPKVEVSGINWETLSLTDAKAVAKLKVENMNQFAATLNALSYDLNLGDVSLATGELKKAIAMEPGKAAELEIPISIKPIQLGTAAFNMIKGDSASYSIDGKMDLLTDYGPLSTDYQKSGKVPLTR